MSRAFDFIHPEYLSLELEKNSEIIPFNALKMLFEADIAEYEKVIEAIVPELRKQSSKIRIFHLGFPPPVEEDSLILENIDPYLMGNKDDLKIVSPNLRFKLWRLYTDLYEKMCIKHQLDFISVPESAMVNNMFLKPEGFENATHANQWYAKKYINHLSQFIK